MKFPRASMPVHRDSNHESHHDRMLALYEQIAEHAADMEDAAVAGNWTNVSMLERECAALIGRLRQEDKTVPLNAGQRERKAELITRILRSDAHVRTLAQPVMSALQQQMVDARRGSRAHYCYDMVARY